MRSKRNLTSTITHKREVRNKRRNKKKLTNKMVLLDSSCCLHCQQAINLSSDLFKCAKCDIPVHTKCMQLTRIETKLLGDTKKKKVYFCFRCDGKSSRVQEDLSDLKKNLENHSKILQNLGDELKKIQNSLDKINVGENLESSPSIDALCFELNERRKREKNIIIHNLQENETNDDDRNEVIKILKKVCPELNTQKIGISRLGKQQSQRSRPLKVVLSNRDEARVIMFKKRSVNLGKIFISIDQTPAQRKSYLDLKKELDLRREEGEKDIVIRYFQGCPKIVSKTE